ncbi:MAG: DUF1800 family protein [Actinomycetota bacterium]
MTLTASDARHLLRRAGYGGLDSEVANLTGRSRADAVAIATTTSGTPDAHDVPLVAGTNRTGERRMLARWWVDQMANSPAPVVERLMYFWHSHFANTSDRVRDQRNMRNQHWLFRRYGLGPFRELLQRVAIDPAMLIDLDNASNVAGDEQENFARELMELYTIGNGMFSEDEVIAMARAWTGHNLEPGAKPPAYQFHSNRHDKHEKTLFGLTRKWDGPETIDELVDGARKDQTAWYLATKLWREFGDPAWASAELITHLAETWKNSDGNALAVIRAIFLRDEFWAPERRYAVVKQPIAWMVELERRTGIHLNQNRLDSRGSVMGQQLFLPPSVAGWGHNGAWLSASAVLGRARLMRELGDGIQKSGLFSGLKDETPAAAAGRILSVFGVPDASDQTVAVVTEWCTNAREELNSYWYEREAGRFGALLPEVNLA